ncbi:hypothetical protein ACJVDH_07525 [Pedobacter sp. AW1-32]|uniref:hypothetical protein n=1 Tax=Pedobacter sp. AW1-32 TaxID=3383026 RepID=UPI003FEED358
MIKITEIKISVKLFLFYCFAALLMFSGCTTNYYLTVSDIDTPVYADAGGIKKVATIEAGKAFIQSGKIHKTTIRYGRTRGYSSYFVSWKPLRNLTKKQLDELIFTADYGYIYSGIPTSQYQYGKLLPKYPGYSSTGSGHPSVNAGSASGGSVHVKGYTRKDGTYVRPHTRSAPRKR